MDMEELARKHIRFYYWFLNKHPLPPRLCCYEIDYESEMLYSFYKSVKSFDSEKSKFTNYCGIAMLRARSRFIKHHTNRVRPISLETLKRRKGLSNPLVIEEPEEGYMVRFVNILRKRIEMLPPHKARMLRMRAEGSTLEEIAAELGVTKQRVWRIIGDEIEFMTGRMNRS